MHQCFSRLHLVPSRDLVPGQLERGAEPRVETVERADELGTRHRERFGQEPVEPLREVAKCGVAALPHLVDDRRDGRADVVGRAGRSRERATEIRATAEIDTSQHGERLIVPGTLVRPPSNSTPTPATARGRDKLPR